MTSHPAPRCFPKNRKCQKHAIPFPNTLTTPVRLTPCQATTYEPQPGISPAHIALADPAPESHFRAKSVFCVAVCADEFSAWMQEGGSA